MVEQVTLENMTEDETRWYYSVTRIYRGYQAIKPEKAIELLQETRESNAIAKQKVKTDNQKLIDYMYETAGTLD